MKSKGKSQEYEQCKCIVESLLVSTATGLTLPQLKSDYHEIEGTAIPFYELGWVY